VIPTIAYHLADNSTCHLKAVAEYLGEQTTSFHTYTTSADGSMPVLSLSLPEGLYNPCTPLYATGIPGEELMVSSSGSQSGNLDTYPIPSDSGKAPCEEIYLPGSKDETVTLTLTSEGAAEEKFQYQISHTWIPYDASSAIDFQKAENLYSGSEPVARPTEGNHTDISGQQISTTADGVLWVKFESARLVYDSSRSKYCVSADAGSTMTVGTVYRPGEVVISFNKISIIQQENSCCLSPGTFRNDLTDNTHVWQASSGAPALYADNAQINHSVTFTATSPVNIYGLETAHTVITGSSDVVADPTAEQDMQYFDLYGRQLQQKPASGMYIVRSGKTARLMAR
ncbi:MAG: hypothetical protein K2I56_00570, partial [Muribaculaceae bacterium]|nr:hypothetical protein [Muribaculaceae bacterium]